MINKHQFLDQIGLDILLLNIKAKMDNLYASKNGSETVIGSQQKVDAVLKAANAYTDEKFANIASPEANEQIASHNVSTNAHNDIRSSITNALAAAKDYSNNNLDTAKNYIDDQIDKIPDWAMNQNKPNYTASEVGAESVGSIENHNNSNTSHNDIRNMINNKFSESKEYTNQQIDSLRNLMTSKLANIEVITELQEE